MTNIFSITSLIIIVIAVSKSFFAPVVKQRNSLFNHQVCVACTQSIVLITSMLIGLRSALIKQYLTDLPLSGSLAVFEPGWQETKIQGGTAMTADEIKAVFNAAGKAWNEGHFEGYLGLYSSNIVLHGYAGLEPGIENVRQFYREFWLAFPGSQLHFEDVFVAGDRLACRFRVEAEHKGTFQGVPPTGKKVTLPGITILRFENSKCVERWSQADFLGLLVQLGAISL